MPISIKNESELNIMRKAGKILAEIMREIQREVKPGIDTMRLDKLAEELVFANGGKAAFKGYGGKRNPFPATICASLNDEIVHGIPRATRLLKEGDILKVDMGIEIDGYFSDMARTFPVGRISPEAKKLAETVEKCFWKGVKKMRDGARLSDYSCEAEKIADVAGFSVVRDLVGHGIGKKLHEDPQIPNYYEKFFRDLVLKSGMTFALEPMINAGSFGAVMGEDGWVFRTADGSLSAHYENTVAITKNGVEVLTM